MDLINLISNYVSILATGNICDADKVQVKVMDSGIRALEVNMKMAGPAYTVECSGGNNLPIHQAIAQAPAGCVLVINVKGYMKSGHIGDIISTACQVRGIVGIVIDGTCRDVEDIVKMRFPVFARGSSPHSNLKISDGKFNQAIQCGGLTINPGDIIFADASGVIAFPQKEALTILEKAKGIAVTEMGEVQQLNQGKTTMEIYNFPKAI